MTKTITAFLNVRTQSSRCPNKMLKDFANTTLFDIALNKLKDLEVDEKYVCAYDDIFIEKSKQCGVPTFRRSLESVSIDGPLVKVFHSFYHFKSDYVMFLNPCHAHLKTETIQSAIDFFKKNHYISLTSVVASADWVFDASHTLMNKQDLSHADTKKTQKLFRASHCFHIYERKRFLDTGVLFKFVKGDPYLYEVEKIEALDVDDQDDFLISEAVYRHLLHCID